MKWIPEINWKQKVATIKKTESHETSNFMHYFLSFIFTFIHYNQFKTVGNILLCHSFALWLSSDLEESETVCNLLIYAFIYPSLH